MNAPTRALHDVPRSDWTREEITALFALPFAELMFRAASVHRAHFDPNQVQTSTLLSIKTGGCPEDCGYCSQSAKNDTGLKASKLMEIDAVLADASAAKTRSPRFIATLPRVRSSLTKRSVAVSTGLT